MIREILDNLKQEERTQLMHAFEEGFSQIVHLPNNKFIAVNYNIPPGSDLVIESVAGAWVYGSTKKGN
jgi:hypothetical protein